MKIRFVVACIAAALSGCTVGPNYVRPMVDTPPAGRIAHDKAAILEGRQPGGTPVYNADLPTTPILRAKALAMGAHPVGFGSVAGADWRLVEARISDEATVCRATRRGEALLYKDRKSVV